jgi:hypothetical protein
MPIVQNITPACSSNYGPGGDGHPCTTNVTTWSSPADLANYKMLPIQINELRAAINDEENRRLGGVTNFGANETSGGIITAADWAAIRNAINTFETYDSNGNPTGTYKTFSWTQPTPASGVKITDEIVEEMRAFVNDAENDCLCNCNYCTCNCNYCTCNCNYCTCNCNYCTCNCNYSCTCNCNYSDEELKKNIIYI